jgi:E3 ubiquitin-protein ligase RNF13
MSYDEVLAEATQLMLMAIILSVTLLFGGIIVLVLIHVCIVGRASRRGFFNGTMVERGSAGSTSMSREDLDKLPCYDYRANEERSSSPVDCAVCLENFKMGDKCRLLPACKHSFHAQCVDAWLLKTPICPICRTSAESWKGVSVSGEGSSHFSDLSVELRGSQTTGSSHLSDIRIELTESPIIESSSESDIGIELRENQRVGSRSRSRSTHLNDAGVELEDGQANTVGNQLSSDPSPSLDV